MRASFRESVGRSGWVRVAVIGRFDRGDVAHGSAIILENGPNVYHLILIVE
jgi:hypothetical protein